MLGQHTLDQGINPLDQHARVRWLQTHIGGSCHPPSPFPQTNHRFTCRSCRSWALQSFQDLLPFHNRPWPVEHDDTRQDGERADEAGRQDLALHSFRHTGKHHRGSPFINSAPLRISKHVGLKAFRLQGQLAHMRRRHVSLVVAGQAGHYLFPPNTARVREVSHLVLQSMKPVTNIDGRVC